MTTEQQRTYNVVYGRLEEQGQNPRDIGCHIPDVIALQYDHRGRAGWGILYVRPDGAWTEDEERAHLHKPWERCGICHMTAGDHVLSCPTRWYR